jgi:hypothetical protein
MSFDSNFRTTPEYLQIIQEILVQTIYRHTLSAADIVVLATALGVLGTEPIRKNTTLPETAEALIAEGMERGKAVFKRLATSMAILGPSRRFPSGKPIFNN